MHTITYHTITHTFTSLPHVHVFAHVRVRFLYYEMSSVVFLLVLFPSCLSSRYRVSRQRDSSQRVYLHRISLLTCSNALANTMEASPPILLLVRSSQSKVSLSRVPSAINAPPSVRGVRGKQPFKKQVP